jgi:hypothetical protein
MVAGWSPVVNRGNDHHPAVPPQRLPLFQMVLPALRLFSASPVFSPLGQYNRLVELTGYTLLPLLSYTQGFRRSNPTGMRVSTPPR